MQKHFRRDFFNILGASAGQCSDARPKRSDNGDWKKLKEKYFEVI